MCRNTRAFTLPHMTWQHMVHACGLAKRLAPPVSRVDLIVLVFPQL